MLLIFVFLLHNFYDLASFEYALCGPSLLLQQLQALICNALVYKKPTFDVYLSNVALNYVKSGLKTFSVIEIIFKILGSIVYFVAADRQGFVFFNFL